MAEQAETQIKTPAVTFDIRKLAHFRDDGPLVQILSESGTARLVMFVFKAGQRLKEHSTSSQIFVQALRGRVTFTAVGKATKLQAGMVHQLEARIPHDVVAITDAVLLVTMTPSPASHTLEQEVFQHLTPLVTQTTGA